MSASSTVGSTRYTRPFFAAHVSKLPWHNIVIVGGQQSPEEITEMQKGRKYSKFRMTGSENMVINVLPPNHWTKNTNSMHM